MKTNKTFFTILFISAIFLLTSLLIVNIYLLAVSEILFLISAAVLFINNNLKIKTNEKRN
jgi:hypothetical protein